MPEDAWQRECADLKSNRFLPKAGKLNYLAGMDSLNDGSSLPKIYIRYCPACGWMLRSAWIAQEALTTFAKEIDSVTIKPDYENAGLFQVWIDDYLIWCRKKEEGFPQPKELKQRIRDLICPERNLGHSERKS